MRIHFQYSIYAIHMLLLLLLLNDAVLALQLQHTPMCVHMNAQWCRLMYIYICRDALVVGMQPTTVPLLWILIIVYPILTKNSKCRRRKWSKNWHSLMTQSRTSGNFMTDNGLNVHIQIYILFLVVESMQQSSMWSSHDSVGISKAFHYFDSVLKYVYFECH